MRILFDVDGTMLNVDAALDNFYFGGFGYFTTEFMGLRDDSKNEELKRFMQTHICYHRYLTQEDFNHYFGTFLDYHYPELIGFDSDIWKQSALYDAFTPTMSGFQALMKDFRTQGHSVNFCTLTHVDTAKTKYECIDTHMENNGLTDYTINMIMTDDAFSHKLDKTIYDCDVVIEDNIQVLLDFAEKKSTVQLFLKNNIINQFADEEFLESNGIVRFNTLDELVGEIY